MSEIDGPIHALNLNYDMARVAALSAEGFKVIRFSNDEVVFDLDNVILKIKAILDSEKTLRHSASEEL